MRFEALLRREGSWWLIEAPALDVATQGRTRADACRMLEDAVEVLLDRPGLKIVVQLEGRGPTAFLSASDPDQLIPLMLRRQRQKRGLTLAEVARRLGASSVNAVARYEQGRARPTLAKVTALMAAIDPAIVPILRVAA
ncbi:MAG: helix-turn-helix transcriptional regulator [Candidatus Latescibacterota bacterium]